MPFPGGMMGPPVGLSRLRFTPRSHEVVYGPIYKSKPAMSKLVLKKRVA